MIETPPRPIDTKRLPIEKKPWGETWTEEATRTRLVKHLRVRRGGFSSLHYHKHSVNEFLVRTARLAVLVWLSDGVHVITLEPGDRLEVPAGIPHQFFVLADGAVTEIYRPEEPLIEVSEDDIVRLSRNGKVDGKILTAVVQTAPQSLRSHLQHVEEAQ